MARADYIGCEVCNGKGLYDGYRDIRDLEDIAVAVLCPQCTKTHVLTASPKPPEKKCEICGGRHDNDALSDICTTCEARISEEGAP